MKPGKYDFWKETYTGRFLYGLLAISILLGLLGIVVGWLYLVIWMLSFTLWGLAVLFAGFAVILAAVLAMKD